MKLPGIDFTRGAERLAKYNPDSPFELEKIQREKSAAFRDIDRIALKATTDFAKQESENQIMRAMPIYMRELERQIVETNPYDEEGNGVWTKTDKVFKQYSENALASVEDVLVLPFAKNMFRQKALEINSKQLPQFADKVRTLMLNDFEGSAITALESMFERHDYDGADELIDSRQMLGVFNPVQAATMRKASSYGRYSYGMEQEVLSKSDKDWDGTKILELRQRITDDGKLTDTDKRGLISLMETRQLNRIIDDFHVSLKPVEDQFGKTGAYLYADKLLEKFYETDAEFYGGDVDRRHQIYEALREAQRHYKVDAEKARGKEEFLMRVPRRINGDERYDQDLSGIFHVGLGRNVTKNGEWDDDGSGFSDQDVMQNKNNTLLGFAVQLTKHAGRIPAEIENLVSAAFESYPEYAGNAAKFLSTVLNESPDALRWQSQNYHLNDIAALVDYFGNTEAGIQLATQTWREYKTVTGNPETKRNRQQMAESLEATKYFADEFDGQLKAIYGKDAGFAWFDKSVGIPPALKADAQGLYNKYIVITGDPQKALGMAVKGLRFTYGTTAADANGELRLSKYPIERIKSNVLNQKQVLTAVRWQIAEELKLAGHKTDNYIIDPVVGFNPEKPVYAVKVLNDNGLYSVFKYEPELEKTPIYTRVAEARKNKQRITDELAETKIRGAKFRIRNKQSGLDEYLVQDYGDGNALEKLIHIARLKATEQSEFLFGPSPIEGDEEYARYQLMQSKNKVADGADVEDEDEINLYNKLNEE